MELPCAGECGSTRLTTHLDNSHSVRARAECALAPGLSKYQDLTESKAVAWSDDLCGPKNQQGGPENQRSSGSERSSLTLSCRPREHRDRVSTGSPGPLFPHGSPQCSTTNPHFSPHGAADSRPFVVAVNNHHNLERRRRREPRARSDVTTEFSFPYGTGRRRPDSGEPRESPVARTGINLRLLLDLWSLSVSYCRRANLRVLETPEAPTDSRAS